jgi:hypothetical protein
MSGKSPKSASSPKALVSPLFLGLVLTLAIAYFMTHPPALPSLTGPPAASKPYKTLEEFYPFYIGEHSNATNKLLHVSGTSIILLLGLFRPSVFVCLEGAWLVGYFLFPVLIGIPHGFFEFGASLIAYTVFQRLVTGRFFGLNSLIPLIGYAFAWVGHFYYEFNRPATFIYPSFSLYGDFRLWASAALGQEKF